LEGAKTSGKKITTREGTSWSFGKLLASRPPRDHDFEIQDGGKEGEKRLSTCEKKEGDCRAQQPTVQRSSLAMPHAA